MTATSTDMVVRAGSPPTTQWSPPETSDAEEPSEAVDAPGTVRLVSHALMLMDSALRAYAHPDILKMAASVNGPDFVPFHESVFHKAAQRGAPTRWHQDGRTHWAEDGTSLEQPDGSGKTHGFNLSVAWCHCTPENGLWVVPGSHRRWRLANGGEFPPITEWLAGCSAHDAGTGGLRHRQPKLAALAPIPTGLPCAGSTWLWASTNGRRRSARRRPTSMPPCGRESTKPIKYTEDYVLRRARMIPLAIDARRQRYPDEVPYEYQGSYIGDGVWNAQARAEISREGDEYWQRGHHTLAILRSSVSARFALA